MESGEIENGGYDTLFNQAVIEEYEQLQARATALARRFNKTTSEVFKKLNLAVSPASLRANAYTSWHVYQKKYFEEGMR